MHIKGTDSRVRTWRHLQEATGESTTSGALDVAANYYLRMSGGTDAVPRGAVAELLEAADERGSLTGAEIAGILDTHELTVDYSTSWDVGGELWGHPLRQFGQIVAGYQRIL